MKSKIRAFMKLPLAATLLALAALVAPPFVAAEKADSSKPMFIEADALKHDESSKTTTFTARVNATKGTLVLRAAKMVVAQDTAGKQVADMSSAPGERAFFRQKREGLDEFTEGEAESVIYDSDRVQGHLIVYNNISEIFTVDGKPGSQTAPGSPAPRIKAMLTPRNAPAEEATGKTLVPTLRNSPRVTAPAGTKP